MFRSLHYVQDLPIATLLGQAVQKLPPNLKETWATGTVKNKWNRPTLREFNDWLKEEAAAHGMMKVTSFEPKLADNCIAIAKTKTALKVFPSTSRAGASTVGRSVLPTQPVKCTACNETHSLWPCPLFRGMTPTQSGKVFADNKIFSPCLNGQHSIRQCPNSCKCTAEGCSSSQNVLLHGAQKFFPPRTLPRQNNANKNSSIPVKTESEEGSGVVYQTDVEGLLQILENKLQSPTRTETVLALCDSACSHSCISETLAAKLLVQVTATKLTVYGIISQERVDSQLVELKLIPLHSGDTECSTFDVKPFVRKHFSVGNDFINVDGLKQR